jgi:hypothetical protein
MYRTVRRRSLSASHLVRPLGQAGSLCTVRYMQTFLPYPDLHRSPEVLDDRRLGKQRVEAYQILRTLLGVSTGWRHHPAVRMWRGCEGALGEYALACCSAWAARGRRDTVAGKVRDLLDRHRVCDATLPPWWGDDDFHRSHRSNLVRKDPGFYRPLFEPGLPDDLPYLWPAPREEV